MVCGLLLIVATTATAVAQTAEGRKKQTPEQPQQQNQEQTPERQKPQLNIPDSLRAVYKYTDALKKIAIHGDTTAS